MKNKKWMLVFLCCIFFCTNLLAQIKDTWTITGSVVTKQKSPIKDVVTALCQLSDSFVVQETYTNVAGIFTLTTTLQTQYLLHFSCAGYNDLYINVAPTGNRVINIGNIFLSPTNNTLDAVVVSSHTTQSLVEAHADRLVVNVAASPVNAGSMALDVLAKSPGIAVKQDDGTISLKGKTGVVILIDGKQTYLPPDVLYTLLKTLPANEIESIEIMTNPPAKYSAAGTAGVINIKTKHGRIYGFNGSITVGGDLGVNNNPKSNNNITGNYRNKYFNIYGSYGLSYNKGYQTINLTQTFPNGVQFMGAGTTVPTWLVHNYRLGLDVYTTKKTTVSINVNGYITPYDHDVNSNTTKVVGDSASINGLPPIFYNPGFYNESRTNFSASSNFTTKLNSKGNELSGDVTYTSYSNNQVQNLRTYNYTMNKSPDKDLRTTQPQVIDIYTGKLDYTHRVERGKFEAGTKISYVKTNNNVQYDTIANGVWQQNYSQSNKFIYQENINAAYVTFDKNFSDKWAIQTGLRVENTQSIGTQTIGNNVVRRNYTQLFPSVYITYNKDSSNTFTLSYGKRIQRPNYTDLNPFTFYLNAYAYSIGNPYLQPELTHNVEFSHVFKKNFVTTLNYSTTLNVITQTLSQIDDAYVVYQTSKNLAQESQWGISNNATIPLTKWWQVNLFTNVYYKTFVSSIYNNALFSCNANLQQQFNLPQKWMIELTGSFTSPMVWGVFVIESMGQFNIAASKSILKDKGSIKFNIRDPFELNRNSVTIKYQKLNTYVAHTWDHRVFSVYFTYQFGNAKVAHEAKKSGASDEQNRLKN